MKTSQKTESKVTIKIPRVLYNRLKLIVQDSGFNSVTDFIIYVLRDLASSSDKPLGNKDHQSERLTKEEIDAIRKRLKSLGYL
jgi:hypothetical protein